MNSLSPTPARINIFQANLSTLLENFETQLGLIRASETPGAPAYIEQIAERLSHLTTELGEPVSRIFGWLFNLDHNKPGMVEVTAILSRAIFLSPQVADEIIGCVENTAFRSETLPERLFPKGLNVNPSRTALLDIESGLFNVRKENLIKILKIARSATIQTPVTDQTEQ